MSLRYDWWGKIAELRFIRPVATPLATALVRIEFAEWFIRRYADWAELAGMQPAHLLSPGGLAQRAAEAWSAGGWSVTCFPRRMHLVADDGHDLAYVYRFNPDGSVSMIFGTERAEILGAQIKLQVQEPAHIRRARQATGA